MIMIHCVLKYFRICVTVYSDPTFSLDWLLCVLFGGGQLDQVFVLFWAKLPDVIIQIVLSVVTQVGRRDMQLMEDGMVVARAPGCKGFDG